MTAHNTFGFPSISYSPFHADLVSAIAGGMPESTAQLLQQATVRIRSCLEDWLQNLAPAVDTPSGSDSGGYCVETPSGKWQGKQLRTWFKVMRREQLDDRTRSLRSCEELPAIKAYRDGAADCVDAQTVLVIRPCGVAAPVGYGTLRVSVRVPQVTQHATKGYVVAGDFSEFYDPVAPQVEVKVVLDELFVLPDYQGNKVEQVFASFISQTIHDLVQSLSFLAVHAPLIVDVDPEVQTLEGVQFAHQVCAQFCSAFEAPQEASATAWEPTSVGYPLEYRHETLRVQVRHAFQFIS